MAARSQTWPGKGQKFYRIVPSMSPWRTQARPGGIIFGADQVP